MQYQITDAGQWGCQIDLPEDELDSSLLGSKLAHLLQISSKWLPRAAISQHAPFHLLRAEGASQRQQPGLDLPVQQISLRAGNPLEPRQSQRVEVLNLRSPLVG